VETLAAGFFSFEYFQSRTKVAFSIERTSKEEGNEYYLLSRKVGFVRLQTSSPLEV